jgi:Protein of unknown function (DUF4054)
MSYSMSGAAGPYGNEITAMVQQIKADASNVIAGTNSAYTKTNFLAVFPQFAIQTSGDTPTDVIPDATMQLFIAVATASLAQARWGSYWEYAMALYIAHFCTLFLQTQVGPNSTAAQVVATAETKFPKASKGVGDISVSFDTSSISGDLPGWAAWKSTTFGLQLATMASALPSAKAGAFIW